MQVLLRIIIYSIVSSPNHISGDSENENIVCDSKYTINQRWKVEDDEGVISSLTIKDVTYIPQVPYCILLPQHWAQQAKDTIPVLCYNGIKGPTPRPSHMVREQTCQQCNQYQEHYIIV